MFTVKLWLIFIIDWSATYFLYEKKKVYHNFWVQGDVCKCLDQHLKPNVWLTIMSLESENVYHNYTTFAGNLNYHQAFFFCQSTYQINQVLQLY